MAVYGLLGRTLGHSLSPYIHNKLGGYEYKLVEVEPENLPAFMENKEFDGINITVPYKIDVMKYIDELTERAREIGSVNTVVNRNGKLIGDNTDAAGFEYTVKKSGIDFLHKKVVILGSGGASKAVQYTSKKLGAGEIIVISRSGDDNYDNIEKHSDCDIVINCTPVGMWKNTDIVPVSANKFNHPEAYFDIIYNPPRTQLMLDFSKNGVDVFGGLDMLVYQAAESSSLFTGNKYTACDIDGVINMTSRKLNNIILIGMPGSGKSSMARDIAKATGKRFLDSDIEVVKMTGRRVPDIIKEDGERVFRASEHEALKKLTLTQGSVISTGGGALTNPDNMDIIKRSGTVVYIVRPTDMLSRKGRPLSQGVDLNELYEKRRNNYERAADITVINDDDKNLCTERILRSLGY